MTRQSLAALAAAVAMMTAPAFADSINVPGIGMAGTIGGTGGYHTLVLDGVSCKLKNSTQGPNAGCNYTITGEITAMGKGQFTVKTGNQGCSTQCQ